MKYEETINLKHPKGIVFLFIPEDCWLNSTLQSNLIKKAKPQKNYLIDAYVLGT